MCDGASELMAATAIVSAVAGFAGQEVQAQQQASYQKTVAEQRNQQMLQNAENANDAAIEQYYQQGLRQQQEAEAASDEIQRVQTEKLQKVGEAIASSDGQLGALYADFDRQEAQYKESVRRNFDMTSLQIMQEARTTHAQNEDRINSMSPYTPQPVQGGSLINLGMGIGKGVLNGYANHKSVTEKNSPWQGLKF
ncbi:MAG: hypothetical protein AB7D39_11795 [Pseudodesulfovibrio sp.]|uniref:virion core protein, T7 gp14 family n=1 Tax=Pseudodesulfovibrio sp. TaxID=2035812 RepID=UPI003D0C6C34